jgi:hypothetical protein
MFCNDQDFNKFASVTTNFFILEDNDHTIIEHCEVGCHKLFKDALVPKKVK